MSANDDAGMAPDMHELAGEYVLGTLPASERRAIEARLPHDEALRAAVLAWEERLLPLTDLVEPVQPSARLWKRIERSVDAHASSAAASTPAACAAPTAAMPSAAIPSPARARSAPSRWCGWNNLGLWRALTAGSFATAAVLAVVLADRISAPAPAPQFMVVLVAPDNKAPGWVIQVGMSPQLNLIPLAVGTVPQDKALQFWTKGEGWSGPVSLGLVKPGQSVKVALDKLPPLQPNQLFELTLEPATGSPIGKPTGPIQFIGRAVKVM